VLAVNNVDRSVTNQNRVDVSHKEPLRNAFYLLPRSSLQHLPSFAPVIALERSSVGYDCARGDASIRAAVRQTHRSTVTVSVMQHHVDEPHILLRIADCAGGFHGTDNSVSDN